MSAPINTVSRKQDYALHNKQTGSPVVAETTNLTTLNASSGRGAFNARGFNSVHGFVLLTGGTAPTVTLQVLERVSYIDPFTGAASTRLVERGSSIGPLLDGETFEVETAGGGLYYLRVDAVANSPTGVAVMVSGGLRANEGRI